MGLSLAARSYFWSADRLVERRSSARSPRVAAAHRLLRQRAASMRWSDYETVAAARHAELDVESMTWGETPLSLGVALLRRAGVDKHASVLDLGAGIGTVLLAARALGAEARGVELSSSRVAVGAAAAAAAGAALSVGDARDAPFGEPGPPTHVFVAWTTWSPVLRAAITTRLQGLPGGTRVLCFTHEPGDGFVVNDSRRVLTPWGFVHALLTTRV